MRKKALKVLLICFAIILLLLFLGYRLIYKPFDIISDNTFIHIYTSNGQEDGTPSGCILMYDIKCSNVITQTITLSVYSDNPKYKERIIYSGDYYNCQNLSISTFTTGITGYLDGVDIDTSQLSHDEIIELEKSLTGTITYTSCGQKHVITVKKLNFKFENNNEVPIDVTEKKETKSTENIISTEAGKMFSKDFCKEISSISYTDADGNEYVVIEDDECFEELVEILSNLQGEKCEDEYLDGSFSFEITSGGVDYDIGATSSNFYFKDDVYELEEHFDIKGFVERISGCV